MESLWEQTWKPPRFPAQDGDLNTDVLIIGGGMAGVLCAYQLHCAGVPYVLAEAETVCGGITQNTTAKITSQHGLIYSRLISKFGVRRAKQYLAANEAALQAYRELCRHMDCGFEEKAAYAYSVDDRRKIERELEALEKLGFPAEFADKLPLPFHVAGAVRFPNQAQFHPLKFVSGIAKNLHIHEHTRVCELRGTTAVTNHGRIRARKIIVTTHFPFLNKHGSYFLKLYQHRSYVIALQPAPDVDGMYVAAGFNKWGMTASMVSAMILCDLVQGKKNPYEEVFSPARSLLHPQLAVNGFEAAASLLAPAAKRCPHLGCALKWNPMEHTWDCPCHGSRFTEDGKLIDNPATGNLKN